MTAQPSVVEVEHAGDAPVPAGTVLVNYRPTVREALREAWQQRHLTGSMASSVLLSVYRETLLGPAWPVIQVSMDVFGKAFIFGSLAKIKGPAEVPYLLFLMPGLLAWRIFARSLASTTRSFQVFAKLTRDLSFPLLLVPIGATAQFFVDFALYLIAFVGVLVYYGAVDGHLYLNLTPQLVFVPLGLAWGLVLAWSIGFFTGPVYRRARDVRFVIRLVLPFWLYLTPIIYPLDRLHGTVRTIAELNPMAPVVEMVKVGALGVGVLHFWSAAWALFVTVVLFVGGVWFISRYGGRLVGVTAYDDDDEEELT